MAEGRRHPMATKFCSCGSGFQPRFGRGKMPLPHKNKNEATHLEEFLMARKSGIRNSIVLNLELNT
jgi:hypothetical protein